MLNVQQITATLAKLPDVQLQQYAQLHKSDPYIMALAMSESNRRKEVRGAGQAPAQAQPKVVDQEIAQMAPRPAQPMPEDQGIGQLPAGNMNFAGGGIIAFADGGGVERYDGTSGSFTGVPYADVPAAIAAVGVPVAVYRQAADLAARMGTNVSSILGRMGYDVAKMGASGVTGAAKLAATGPGQVVLAGGVPATQFATDIMASNPKLREAYADNPMMGAMDPNAALAAAILDQSKPNQKQKAQETLSGAVPTTAAQGAPTAAPVSTADMAAKASASPYTSGAALSETAALLNRYPKEKPEAPPAAPPAARPSAAPGIGMPSYAGLDAGKLTSKALEEAGKKPNIFAKDIEAIGQEKVSAKEAEVTGLEAIQQKFDNIFKGRKERMDTKEAEISKMGDQNLGLALLNAGAAMMSTPGGIGAAFGKGVDVGSKQYVAGIDKINAAKDKLADARDRLEEIEAQRGEMSARELFKARNDVKNTQISAKEDLVKSNMQRYDINRADALKMVDNQIKIGISQIEQAGATARTGAQIASAERLAAMPTGEAKNIMMLGTGATDAAKYESGLKKMQDITSDKTGMAAFKILGEINAKHANDPSFKPLTMADLTSFLSDYQRSMRAGPANVSGKPTGKAFE